MYVNNVGVNELTALHSEQLELTGAVRSLWSRFHNHMQFGKLIFSLHRSTARITNRFSHYPAFCECTVCIVYSAAGDTCCMLKQNVCGKKLLLFRPQRKPPCLANAAPSLTTNLFTGRGFVITGLSSCSKCCQWTKQRLVYKVSHSFPFLTELNKSLARD